MTVDSKRAAVLCKVKRGHHSSDCTLWSSSLCNYRLVQGPVRAVVLCYLCDSRDVASTYSECHLFNSSRLIIPGLSREETAES